MADLRHELQVLLAANAKWFPKKWGSEAPSERDMKIRILADKIAEFLERCYAMDRRPEPRREISKYDGQNECPLDGAKAVLEGAYRSRVQRPAHFSDRAPPGVRARHVTRPGARPDHLTFRIA